MKVVRPAVKPLLVARSILKFVSLLELSVQVRLIWLEVTGVARKPDGAFGTVCEVVVILSRALLASVHQKA